MLYSPSKKKFVSDLWHGDFSYKINNNTAWWKSEEQAKEHLEKSQKDATKSLEDQRVRTYPPTDTYWTPAKQAEQIAFYEKRVKALADVVPSEQVMPIMFDKRGCKPVKWIEDEDRSRRYCTCCGVRITQKRAIIVGRFTLCVMCLNAMASQAKEDVEEFERDYPEQMEIYRTERFLRAL
jgi:hypothetical protein